MYCELYYMRIRMEDIDNSDNVSDQDDDVNQSDFDLEQFDIVKTVGTGEGVACTRKSNSNEIYFIAGTFARVCLCLHKPSSKHFALKILSFHEVIRLKQVEHVKSEKNILQVRKNIKYLCLKDK